MYIVILQNYYIKKAIIAEKKKRFTRREAFAVTFNVLKEKGEFIFDDLVQGIDDLYVKKNKSGKSNIDSSKWEERKGLQYIQALGIKVKEETIRKVYIGE